MGIDPGSQHLGLGIIKQNGNKSVFVLAEVLSPPSKQTLFPRLTQIANALEKFMEIHRPTEVAIENIFIKQNPKSVFHLGIARGIAISACLRRGLEIHEYAPTAVKLAVAGHGRADKEQVKKMAELILGTRLTGRFDASDAIAVALCHASMRRTSFARISEARRPIPTA